MTSVMTSPGPRVPQFRLHHRLRLALEEAGVEPAEMARTLGLALPTINAYMNGGRNPKLGMVKLWGMRTGVPWQWLMYGVEPQDGDTVTGGNTLWQRRGNRPGRSSNRPGNSRFLKCVA